MKCAAAMLFVFAVACSREAQLPTGPTITGPPPSEGGIAGFVRSAVGSGVSYECIIGARIEIVDGPKAGTVQIQETCAYNDLEPGNGFFFAGLPLDRPTTIRATADGYLPAEVEITATPVFNFTTTIALNKQQ